MPGFSTVCVASLRFPGKIAGVVKRLLLLSILVTSLACGPAAETQEPAAAPVTHAFEELAPGVFFAVGDGPVHVASNALVVVNDEDILVVDSHITPDAARALLASVATLTDKPVRYLVNSHFHFDHAHGNQVFPPEVQTIGHEYTRARLLGDVLNQPTYLGMGGPVVQQQRIDGLKEQLAAASADEKESLEAQIAPQERHLTALGEVEPTPPNTTLQRKMTLHRGSREIQLLHLGRGHTGGDVVVFLPAEKVAFTGDLFYKGAPYLGDSYPEDFIETLEALKGLDFDVAAPGHGPLVRDKAQIDFNQEYLRKYWGQVKASHAAGRTLDQAIDSLDLTGYEQFAASRFVRRGVLELEVGRMYSLLNGEDPYAPD